MNTAVLGAELAKGDGPERIYLVEATCEIEDDPNVTDKKFPGNPTKSYRSIHPFKVIGEVKHWHGRTPEQINTMKEGLEKLKAQGLNVIID
jgi:rifampin ADP-ribosylating transferase